jgi:uroporphyrin-III C-methyltransferase
MSGKVYLVGAGPGDPELLTLKAVRLLRSADVVLHDELIGSAILQLIPSTTILRNVGKRGGRKNIRQQEIDTLLVQYALLGLQVVRLKGGDPLIFGRAGEEIEALRRARIEFEIVPGISAMLGAAAAVQLPLTHRELSSSLLLLTGHSSTAGRPEDWPAYISSESTVVVYMPGYDYAGTSHHLISCGLEGNMPCAVISQATSADQQIYRTTLQDLHTAPHLPSPTLLLIGQVVQFALCPSPENQFAPVLFDQRPAQDSERSE